MGAIPLMFVWPYLLPFWAVSVWVFWPEYKIVRDARRTTTAKDGKSLQVIIVGIQLAMLAAYPLAFVRAFQIGEYRVAVYVLGIAIIIAASLLRRHCWRMLGGSFTGDVRATADQQVITRGAYSIVRHPSYTAAIMLNVGTGVALGSWASLLILVVASFVVYSYRMTVEERALLDAIGEPYREFMSTRKRVIPFVY